MSVKYFTGCNNVTSGGKNQSSDTALDVLGLPDTEPADNADGIDAKGQGKGSKWDRIKAKVYSASAIQMKGGKARGTKLTGKYDLGKMMKYRKTLKKLYTDIGFAAHGTSKGERNMFSGKGDGHEGNKNNKADANDSPLYPMDGVK
jgi:hypothetical protein